MNNIRRKETRKIVSDIKKLITAYKQDNQVDISEVLDEIEDFKYEIEYLKDEEEVAFGNMPESLQSSDRGMQMEEYIELFDDAISMCENLIDSKSSIENIIENLTKIAQSLEIV